ncbi:MAG: hypothetical protein SF029_13840 [bacterium]|nr:hypothetical protein [bacterium]
MVINRIIAAILILLVVVIFPVGIWAVAASGAAFSAETYKNGLVRQNLYPDIVPVVVPALVREADQQSDVPNLIINLNTIRTAIGEDTWREITTALVPPEWLQTQVESAIDNFFIQLEGDNEAASETADFSEVSTRLRGEVGQEAIAQILAAAPACTEDELARLEATSPTLLICNPPEDAEAALRTQLSAEFVRFASVLDQFETNFNDLSGIEDDGLVSVRLGIEAFGQLLSLGYLCPIGLLALVVTLTVRSFKGFARWIGLPLILVGIFALLPLPFLRAGIADNVTSILTSSSGNLEERVFQARLATGLLLSGFDQFSAPVSVQGFAFIVVGLILLLVMWLRERRDRTQFALTPEGQIYSVATGKVIGSVTPADLPRPSSSDL